MATKKKILQAAAGQAGGAGLNVEDVFSTYLYTGSDSATTVTNNVDLSTEGGLVWVKSRANESHYLVDTERGVGNALRTNSDSGTVQDDGYITSFNTDGFTIGANEFGMNENGVNYASWTFRKAPKFFDVVTYTGDGTSGRAISHNLGSAVGSVFVKRTDSAADWVVFHKDGNGVADGNAYLRLNTTAAASGFGRIMWGNGTSYIAPTDTTLTINSNGNADDINVSGATYVAYLFAHNNDDGEFGPDGDADIIKCGSFTASGKTASVDLGFEPQWILTKCSSAANAEGWEIFDSMRGMPVNKSDNRLFANSSIAEETGENSINLRADGFDIEDNIVSGGTYIYIAIRRGTKVPESGTEVFAMDTGDGSSNPAYYSGFPVDFAYTKDKSNVANWLVGSRLTQGKLLSFNTTSAESANSVMAFDYSDRWYDLSRASNYYSGMWKRAPKFFDVVAYTGTGSARTVSHNLGVAPEMMWVKNRDRAYDWFVYDKVNGATNYMLLNESQATTTSSTRFNDTEPTDTVFTVGSANQTNQSGDSIIAYLFASLDGISKVGSYTGNGGTQTIDCGFTSGARFVLIKSATESRSWCVFDTERGIVSGNDPVLYLQATSAEVTSIDWIDPHSSGFTIDTSQGNINGSGQTYIFYAIA